MGGAGTTTYEVGDNVLVRQVRWFTSLRTPWRRGRVVGVRARPSWLGMTTYHVRLLSGEDAGKILEVDERSLRAG